MPDIEVVVAVAPGAKIVVYFAPNTDAGFLDAPQSGGDGQAQQAFGDIDQLGWSGIHLDLAVAEVLQRGSPIILQTLTTSQVAQTFAASTIGNLIPKPLQLLRQN